MALGVGIDAVSETPLERSDPSYDSEIVCVAATALR